MNEIILTSSVLIVILAILRRVLRGRIAPTLQYALWLLVAARLLIPGTLFTAPVTVLGLAEDVRTAVIESLPAETPPATENTLPVYIPDQTIPFDPAPMPDTNGTADTAPMPQILVSPAKLSIDWLDVIWKTGIFVVGTAFLISNLIFYGKLRRSRQRIPAAELPIPCPIPVYYTEDLSAPCLFGLKSAIYINRSAMSPRRLRHVIAHELTHRRHGDHIWALLRCVCLSIHWYNPLVWWAAILSRRDCEISCDSAVLRTLDDDSGISYGETLLAMLSAAPISLLHTATTMGGGKRTMAERLKLIVHRPRMMKLTLIIVAVVTMGAVMLTFGGCGGNADSANSDDPVINVDEPTQTEKDTPAANDPADNGKLPPPENGFGFIPSPSVYIHPSMLFSMELPTRWRDVLVFEENEDGVSFYDADTYRSGSEDGWIFSVHPQPADWTGYRNPTTLLAEFDPNGTPQVYLLEYNSELSETYAELWQEISASFVLNASPEQFSRLIHDNYKENIALAISYLPYLSWRSYRELYDFYELELLQSALYLFADSGQATWDQYHDILSLTNDGLDGAYSEGLSGIFAALYLQNSERFLSVVNSEYITNTERARVAEYVKYELNSQPNENDSDEITFSDSEVIMGLARGYGPTVFSTGSPAELTTTLTGDWTLNGIRNAIFRALSEAVSGTLLDGDLRSIEIAYSFRFPEDMRSGTVLSVPFYATYVDQDIHPLPSGATHSPSCRTSELTATIHLTGEGITAPVDEDFAAGQAFYELLTQLLSMDTITVSRSSENFDLLDTISTTILQRLSDKNLSETCRPTGMSCGQYYNPLWCDVGYEQAVEYTINLMYQYGEQTYQYSFRCTVNVITTE